MRLGELRKHSIAIALSTSLLFAPLVPLSAQPQPSPAGLSLFSPDETSPLEVGFTGIGYPGGEDEWYFVTADDLGQPLEIEEAHDLSNVGAYLRAEVNGSGYSEVDIATALATIDELELENFTRRVVTAKAGPELYLLATLTESPDGTIWTTLARFATSAEARTVLADFISLQEHRAISTVDAPSFTECPCEDNCLAILNIEENSCRQQAAVCGLAASAALTACLLLCAAAGGSVLCVLSCVIAGDLALTACALNGRICINEAKSKFKFCLKQCDP